MQDRLLVILIFNVENDLEVLIKRLDEKMETRWNEAVDQKMKFLKKPLDGQEEAVGM